MRIAIPVHDHRGLDEEIFEHFGHAPAFLIVDVEGGKVISYKTIENPFASEHGPGAVPSLLSQLEVEVLIARGMGRRARYFLEQMGIGVITGASGKVDEVLDALISGQLVSVEYEPKEKWREEKGHQHDGCRSHHSPSYP